MRTSHLKSGKNQSTSRFSTAEIFTDLPSLPTIEKVNRQAKELREERLKMKQNIDIEERKNLKQIEEKEKSLQSKIPRLKRQSDRNDRKNRGESYIDDYENSPQQFLDLTTELPPRVEYKERTEDFQPSQYQKELFEQLLDLYVTYRDLPLADLNKVKKFYDSYFPLLASTI